MSPPAVVPDTFLVPALGWTLIHFLWQGALVAALLSIANALLRRRGASNARYVAGCMAMLLMLALPAGTFLRALDTGENPFGLAQGGVQVPGIAAPASGVAAEVPPATEAPAGANRANADALMDADPLLTSGSGRLAKADGVTKSIEDGALVPGAASQADIPAASSSTFMERLGGAAGTMRAGLASIASYARPYAESRVALWLPWLVALWVLGVMLLSVRLIGGWVVAQRIKAFVERVPMDELQRTVDALRRRIGVSQPVRICRSMLVEVPTVIGWLRPIVLVPASALTGLSARQLEALLAHELAHVRRYDYLVNLVQTVVETLLFYHPAVWWVSRRIRAERENCCDDIAVEACGDRVVYARALWELERMRAATPNLAMAANGGSLIRRIRRLIGPPQADTSLASRSAAGVVAMGAVLFVVMGLGPATNDGNEDSWDGSIFRVASADKTAPHVAANDLYLERLHGEVHFDQVHHDDDVHIERDADSEHFERFEHEAHDVHGACDVHRDHDVHLDMHVEPDLHVDGHHDGVVRGHTGHQVHVDDCGEAKVCDCEAPGVLAWVSDAPPAPRAPRATAAPRADAAPAPEAAPSPRAAPAPAPAPRATPAPRVSPGIVPLAPVPPAPSLRYTTPRAPAPDAQPHHLPMRVPRLVNASTTFVPASAPATNGPWELPGWALIMNPNGDVTVRPHVDLDHLEHEIEAHVEQAFAKADLDLESISLELQQLEALADSRSDAVAHLSVGALALEDLRDYGITQLDLNDLQMDRLDKMQLDHLDKDELKELRRRLLKLKQYVGYLNRSGVSFGYIKAMADLGYDDEPAFVMVKLLNAGVSPDYVRALQKIGYSDMSIGQLVTLRTAGVSEGYARSMRDLLGDDMDVETLVTLRAYGVTEAFVSQMRDAGYSDLDSNDLVLMRVRGITPEYVRGFSQAGLEEYDLNDLVHLREQGVTPEWVSGLKWLGYEVDEDRLVELRHHGISLGYVAQMRQVGYRDLTLDQLIELRQQGVTPEYVATMRMVGVHDTSPEAIVELRQHGVSAEYAAQMKAAFGRAMTGEELVELRNHGVSVQYAANVVNLGFRDLGLEEIIELANHGVSSEYVRNMRATGYGQVDAGDLIQLYQHGVSSSFVKRYVAAGYGHLSVDDLCELRKCVATAAFVKKAEALGYDRLTVEEVCRLKQRGLRKP